MAKPLGYRPELDGVRGVAIAFVVAQHLWDWPRNGGALGVQIFFVLSGFLITTLLLEEHQTNGRISLGYFYIRRALRLLPLLYATLAVCAVVAAVAAVDRSWYLESIASSALYIGNLYGLVASHTDLAPAVGHLWSLAVEEQFYVVFPLLLIAALRWAPRRLIALTLGAAVVAVLFRGLLIESGRTVWTLPTTYADALFAGCLLAMWRLRRPLPDVGWLAPAVLVVATVLPTIVLERAAGLAYLLPTFVGVVVVAAAVHRPAWLRGRWLVYLGGISYGVYVLHGPVAYAVDTTFDMEQWLAGIVIAVLTLGLAAVSRRTLEAWFLRRKPEPPGRVNAQAEAPAISTAESTPHQS